MEDGSVLAGAGKGKARDCRSLAVEIEVAKMGEPYGDRASHRSMEASESDATSIMKGCCSSWVVEMEKMLEDAKPSVEMARWNRHSIYRVCHYIKQNTNSEAYSPQFVSLGPLHHGEPHLQPMEEHKRRAVLHMVNRSGKPLHEFVAAIDEVADELQAAYNDLDDKWRGTDKGRFVEMMVMDGCFLLEWAWTVGIGIEGGYVAANYATNDPIFSMQSYRTLWPIIRRDMIAMENQLPLLILQRLLAVQIGKLPTAREINNIVLRILEVPGFDEGMDELGLHSLDIFHKSYCGASPQSEEADKYKYDEPCTPCAIELSEAGIQFRTSNTKNIHDVDFENGVLSMPFFKLHDETEAALLNLMVFEWLHPDANSFVRSYISFVDQMVVSERDAELLRSAGIFPNMIGSDKKVIEIFNTLTKLAATPKKGSKLGYVNWMVNIHCKKRRNKWRAIFMKTYLSDPWVILSMVAAFILLLATLLQTGYTVVPYYTKR